MDIEELLSNYHEEFGDVDYLISTSNYFPGHIAVITPIEDEDISFSTLTTIGLSNVLKANGYQEAEIVLEIEGDVYKKFGEEFFNNLAEYLFKAIVAKESFNLYSIVKFENLINSTPFFYVNQYDGFSTEWFGESGESVKLLKLTPLTAKERDEIFDLSKRDKEIIINENYQLLRDTERAVDSLIESAINRIWTKIEEWYSKNTQTLLTALGSGASLENIKGIEEKMGLTIPRDYRYSLLAHNGKMSFHNSYKYLTYDEVYIVWNRMNNIMEKGGWDKKTKNKENKIVDLWWNKKWIPFAEDSTGNLICIDLDPGKEGNVGQIIYWEKEEGPLTTEFGSYLDWLNYYLKGLFEGVYKVIEGGFLED